MKDKRKSIEEKAEKEWLANAVWLVANGLKHSYYDFCFIHDLQEDHPVSLQMFKNQHIKTCKEVEEVIFEVFGFGGEVEYDW